MFGLFKKKRASHTLMEAMCRCDAGEIAPLMRTQDFVLINTAGDGGHSPYMAEVDGFPAAVVFTAEAHAAAFGGRVPEALGPDGNLDAFVVGGADLLAPFPDDVGLLVNPTSAECAVVPPTLAAQIKRLLTQARG